MRKYILFIIFSVLSFAGIYGQNIIQYQYWFDENPTSLYIVSLDNPAPDVHISVDINTWDLSDGFHTVVLTCVDSDFNRSSPVTKVFYKATSSGQFQYWFDDDFANKTVVDIETQQNSVVSTSLDVSQLSDGFHVFYAQIKPIGSYWSLPVSKYFYKAGSIGGASENAVKAYEYWFDDDFENRQFVEIPVPIPTVELVTDIDVSSLAIGEHTFNIRFQDELNLRSIVQTDTFLFDNTNDFISGTVRNAFVDPAVDTLAQPLLENCTITLIKEGATVQEIVTDAMGEFNFENLDAGIYIIQASITKENTYPLPPVTNTIIYENLELGTNLDIIVPIDLHLQIQRGLNQLQNMNTTIGGNAVTYQGYDIYDLTVQTTDWQTVNSEHEQVLRDLWELNLALRLHNTFNLSVPQLTDHTIDYMLDFMKPLTGIFLSISKIKSTPMPYNANIDIWKYINRIDGRVNNGINKLADKAFPNSPKMKIITMETINNTKLELDLISGTLTPGLGADDIVGIITEVVRKEVTVYGNDKLYRHYINYTQEMINSYPTITFSTDYETALSETQYAISQTNTNNTEAVTRSINLKLWSDYTDIFSDVAGDLGSFLIYLDGGTAGGVLKTCSKLAKVTSFGLIGASIYYPANRYSKMLYNSNMWTSDLNGNNWKNGTVKSYEKSRLDNYSKDVSTSIIEFDNSLNALIIAINNNPLSPENVLADLDLVLLNDDALNLEMEYSLNIIEASLHNADEGMALEETYFATMPNTIDRSNTLRNSLYMNIMAYLIYPETEDILDSINTISGQVLTAHSTINDEYTNMYSEISGVDVGAYIAPYIIIAPSIIINNTNANVDISIKNFGTVSAENLVAELRTLNNNTVLQTFNIGNLGVEETSNFSFSVTAPAVDSVTTYIVSFSGDNTIGEYVFHTIQNSEIEITADNPTACEGDTVYLSFLPHRFYTIQWLKDGTAIENAEFEFYQATESGNYKIQITEPNGYSYTTPVGIDLIFYSLPETPTITQDVNTLISSATDGNQWYDTNGIIEGATGQYFNPEISGDYYVIVTNDNDCSSQSEIYDFVYTNIASISFNNYAKVFPNPTTGIINIELLQTKNENIQIEITNIVGQTILSNSYNSTEKDIQIDISNYATGNYIITIITDSANYSGKIILE